MGARMKELSLGSLLVVGIGLTIVGVVLMFTHQYYQANFQGYLLHEFHDNYHWRSFGDAYYGVSAIVVGGVMVAVAAIVARWP
jgi:ABC-type phosphate transport system permease subunit